MAEHQHTEAPKQPERARTAREGQAQAQSLDVLLQRVSAPFQGGRIDPRTLPPQAILALQRTAGNAAVNQLLQRHPHRSHANSSLHQRSLALQSVATMCAQADAPPIDQVPARLGLERHEQRPLIQRKIIGGRPLESKHVISTDSGKLFVVVHVTFDSEEADMPIGGSEFRPELLYGLAPADNPLARPQYVPGSTDDYENVADVPYLEDFENIDLGQRIGGESSEKDVYLIPSRPNLVIGVSKLKEFALIRLTEEAAMLAMLRSRKIPVVEVAGLTTHGGRPAVVMKLYGEGSKQTVTNDKQAFNRPVRVGNSAYLNGRSIKDLQEILRKCQQQRVSIADIQFLIGTDGSVVIADPLTVSAGKADPSSNVTQMIMRLIEAATENVLFDILQSNKGKSLSEDNLGAMTANLNIDRYTWPRALDGLKKNFSSVKWDATQNTFRFSGVEEVD